MKNVLLTGAGGFVGQAFKSHAHATQHAIIEFKRGDDLAMMQWPEGTVVVHLAGRAHDKGATWEDFEINNIELTKKLLAHSVKSKVSHFIFMSSAKVYGEISTSPLQEDQALNPLTDYGKSKMLAEQLVRESGLNYTIFRPPLVWAEHAKGNLQSLKKISKFGFPLPSNIHNQRSLVELNYLVEILWQSVLGKIHSGQTYNVANMMKSSSQIFALMGVKSFIHYPEWLLAMLPQKMKEKLLMDFVLDTGRLVRQL